ncbi:hypothetical protein RND81_10G178000 [Saponaria officinalis]|uniref:Uncharacterized protein n=1 Tax=Saponaria officinalis TaxID=3572 RepID=A0AAW1I2Z7_SAPOF
MNFYQVLVLIITKGARLKQVDPGSKDYPSSLPGVGIVFRYEDDDVNDDEFDQNEEAGDDASSGGTDPGDDPNDDDPNDPDDDDPDDDWLIELPMCVRRYVYTGQMQFVLMPMANCMDVYPEFFADWNGLAYATHLLWQQLNPGCPVVANPTPANCCGDSVPIFGRLTVNEVGRFSFQTFNWTRHAYMDVRHNINCLVAIAI